VAISTLRIGFVFVAAQPAIISPNPLPTEDLSLIPPLRKLALFCMFSPPPGRGRLQITTPDRADVIARRPQADVAISTPGIGFVFAAAQPAIISPSIAGRGLIAHSAPPQIGFVLHESPRRRSQSCLRPQRKSALTQRHEDQKVERCGNSCRKKRKKAKEDPPFFCSFVLFGEQDALRTFVALWLRVRHHHSRLSIEPATQ
jgi:hypothetical protein